MSAIHAIMPTESWRDGSSEGELRWSLTSCVHRGAKYSYLTAVAITKAKTI